MGSKRRMFHSTEGGPLCDKVELERVFGLPADQAQQLCCELNLKRYGRGITADQARTLRALKLREVAERVRLSLMLEDHKQPVRKDP